ncbi:MAG: hypothetical protein QOJ46_1771 [bacterium]
MVAFALAAVFGGCGGEDFANDERPASTITVAAVVTVRHVTVSPARFGAGTIELLASNQAATSQRVQLRSVRLAGGSRRLAQSTGPINPGGVASLKADLAEGTYVVSASSSAIEPATIVVGAPRAGGSDRLLQP